MVVSHLDRPMTYPIPSRAKIPSLSNEENVPLNFGGIGNERDRQIRMPGEEFGVGESTKSMEDERRQSG